MRTLFCLLTLTCLTACDSDKTPPRSGLYPYLYVDPETQVEYFINPYQVTTLRVNPDGSPRLHPQKGK